MSFRQSSSWVASSIFSAILLSSGCGSAEGVSADDGADEPDAAVTPPPPGVDAALGSDAAVSPTPRCDPASPFDDGTPVAELNQPGTKPGALDEYARLSRDELTVYFSADRPGVPFDIYVATRADPDDPFGEPTPLPGVNTDRTERVPTVTADGLSLFATREIVSGSVDRYRVVGSTRPDVDSDFGPLEILDDVNDLDFNDLDPYVVSDGRALYFASTRTGSADLYRSARTANGFGPPVLVEGTGVNATSFEDSPVVTDDELTIYFASNARGETNIYVATRANAADPFGEPVVIENLSTAENNDWPTWISPDGCLLYFSRSVGLEVAGYDIYVARRGM